MRDQEKLALLNRVLADCKASPFYRKRLPEAALRSLDGIKRLPLTTKDDLRRESPRGLLCAPLSELVQYHESFGTTGAPVSVWLTREDLLASVRATAAWGVGFNEDDVVLVRFPYALSSVAHLVHAAAQSRGACVIPVSSRSTVSPFPRVVEMLRRLNVTVLCCLPLQAVLLAETAEMLGMDPSGDFPHLRAICTAGEPLAAGRRQLIEEIWGVPAFDNYGLTETGVVGLDCEYGRMHPRDGDFVLELLGEDHTADAGPGELGYLVLTTLRRRGTPLIRYLTGDRARLAAGSCPCGRGSILEIHGRKEHTIEVNGRVLDLWDLHDMVSRFPCRRFWLAGPVPGGIRFVIEREKPQDEIPPVLVERLEEEFGLILQVELVPHGTLYDRAELLAVNAVGKPRYIYSRRELAEGTYLNPNGV